jgi:hypothetical protein
LSNENGAAQLQSEFDGLRDDHLAIETQAQRIGALPQFFGEGGRETPVWLIGREGRDINDCGLEGIAARGR